MIWKPFIYISCTVALAKTSSAMLNRSNETEYSCSLSQRRNLQLFTIQCYVSGLVIYGLIYVEVHSNCTQLLRIFVNVCWISSDAVFASVEIIMNLILHLLMWYITLTVLCILNHPYIPRINLTWFWYLILWCTVEFGLLAFFFENFYIAIRVMLPHKMNLEVFFL